MFEDLSSLVEGIVNQLGLTFFLSGFVPMLVGVTINQYVIFSPAVAGMAAVWNFFPQVAAPWLGLFSGEILTTLMLALGLALVILPFNLFITRLFEGLLPGMKAILFPLYVAKRARHRRLYADIQAARQARREVLADYEETGEYDADADLAIQETLQRLHAHKEKVEPLQRLPFDPARLTPTSFGNAWAVTEEYPLARYGMDGMFFWPYLRTILLQENPHLLAQIDNQKVLNDIVVNLAFVAGILAAEGIVLGIAWAKTSLLVLAAISLAALWVFYQAGVQYIRAMGTLIAQSFDLYRLKLLDAFGVARPADLDDEYWLWMRLSAFLRRGEPFYFDLLPRAVDSEKDEWADPAQDT